MKTLRIVFISVLAITTIVGCILVILYANAMAKDSKIGLSILPVYTIMSAAVIYLTEFILYRTIGDLFVKKERYSKFATVLNFLAMIFSVSVVLLFICYIAICSFPIIYSIMLSHFIASGILRYEGASLNRKIKAAKNS